MFNACNYSSYTQWSEKDSNRHIDCLGYSWHGVSIYKRKQRLSSFLKKSPSWSSSRLISRLWQRALCKRGDFSKCRCRWRISYPDGNDSWTICIWRSILAIWKIQPWLLYSFCGGKFWTSVYNWYWRYCARDFWNSCQWLCFNSGNCFLVVLSASGSFVCSGRIIQ